MELLCGEILENKIKTNFIPFSYINFEEEQINVEKINTEEELIEKINELNLNENNLYKIILEGKRNFIIDIGKIKKYIIKENIIKIKNFTKLNYNLEEIAKEESLKGFFVKEAIKQLETADNKKIIEDAIEIGLEALEN